MQPNDHNDVAKFANQYAAEHGSITPDWLTGAIKKASGYDFGTPNPNLTALLQNHADLAQATRILTSTPKYSEKGESNLDNQIGNPLRSDYGQQLQNFMKTYIYPDAGRFADNAFAQHWVLPKDFAFQQGQSRYGQGNVPGGSPQWPIQLQNKGQEAKIANGQWVIDSRGTPVQWGK